MPFLRGLNRLLPDYVLNLLVCVTGILIKWFSSDCEIVTKKLHTIRHSFHCFLLISLTIFDLWLVILWSNENHSKVQNRVSHCFPHATRYYKIFSSIFIATFVLVIL